MWFLIRAAFWLSIVFALMPWPRESGLRSLSVALWTEAGHAAAAIIRQARSEGEKICTNSPAACLGVAAKLGGLSAQRRAQPETPIAAER